MELGCCLGVHPNPRTSFQTKTRQNSIKNEDHCEACSTTSGPDIRHVGKLPSGLDKRGRVRYRIRHCDRPEMVRKQQQIKSFLSVAISKDERRLVGPLSRRGPSLLRCFVYAPRPKRKPLVSRFWRPVL